MNSQSKQITVLLNRTSLTLMLFLCLLFLRSTPTYAICAVHDHNCFHGTEPFNPALADIQTGTGNLTITSTWTGEGDANLHVSLPDNVDQYGNPIYGPFVASNGDGNPVTGSPLGTNPNVLYHGQQTIQWVNASSLANLTSDTQPASPLTTITRNDTAVISGNIPSGQYDFALHSYDERMTNVPVTVSTVAQAGSGAYFLNQGAQSAAQQAAGHNPISNATGTSTQLSYSHTLGATGSVSATETFTYRYPGFSDHANGVYVIPDGVWNMHGVDPQQVYQFASADRSQGFILNQGYQFEMNPFDTQPVDIYGYNNWFFDANSGVYLALNEHGGFDRVAVSTNEFNSLQTGLYVPLEIMQQEGLSSIDSNNRGVVAGFRDRSYNSARSILGCFQCSDERLVSIHQEIVSGSNTYGLTEDQQREFSQNVIRGYSAAGFYRDLKDAYRKNQAKSYVSTAVNFALAVYQIPVNIQLGHQSDTVVGSGGVVNTSLCLTPPCNGLNQNDWATSFGISSFGGTDIVRVDSDAGTIQINDGEVYDRSIYDIAGDGSEEAVDAYDIIEGGSITGAGVGFSVGGGTLGVNATMGPQGSSFGVNYAWANGINVGVNCGGGDCSGRAGFNGKLGIADNVNLTGGFYLDTRSGFGGKAGVGYQGKNVETNLYYDTNLGSGASIQLTNVVHGPDGTKLAQNVAGAKIGLGFDSNTGAFYVLDRIDTKPKTVVEPPKVLTLLDSYVDQDGNTVNVFGLRGGNRTDKCLASDPDCIREFTYTLTNDPADTPDTFFPDNSIPENDRASHCKSQGCRDYYALVDKKVNEQLRRQYENRSLNALLDAAEQDIKNLDPEKIIKQVLLGYDQMIKDLDEGGFTQLAARRVSETKRSIAGLKATYTNWKIAKKNGDAEAQGREAKKILAIATATATAIVISTKVSKRGESSLNQKNDYIRGTNSGSGRNSSPSFTSQEPRVSRPVVFPTDKSQIDHIFRDGGGHLPDTKSNRQLILQVANDSRTKLGTDKFGNVWSAHTRKDGSQVYVITRNGVIQNAGVNDTPRKYNSKTGLSSPTPPVGNKKNSSKSKQIGELFQSKNLPKASEIKKFAEKQGYSSIQTENGPLKYIDENGVVRITIKKGSPRAPGSSEPHVEFRNADGQRVDVNGIPVTRKSSKNHTPIDFDL